MCDSESEEAEYPMASHSVYVYLADYEKEQLCHALSYVSA